MNAILKRALVVAAAGGPMIVAGDARAQGHLGHHPEAATSASASASPAMPPSGCMGGDCAASKGSQSLYPSLMTLSTLTGDQRAEVEALAAQQMRDGMARLAAGADALRRATDSSDDAAMQRAIGTMREGLDQVEAAVAARRVLAEGKSPRNLALNWFKRELSLAAPTPGNEPRHVGLTPFHLITMVLLVAFAIAMVVLYFLKMRRAAELFGRVDSSGGSPPPGAAPPFAPPPPTNGEGAKNAAPTPRTGAFRGKLRVASILSETPSVKTVRLEPRALGATIPFTFVPGQFLNVALSIGGARMNRSYSISSSPTAIDHVDITVRREPRGAVSRHINDLLKPGDEIDVQGPVGRFTFTGGPTDSIVLVAGGVGVTPMMSVARYLTDLDWPGEIFFLYACRAPSDYIFREAIAELQRRNPRLHVTVVMSGADGTEWKGPRGRLTKQLIAAAVPDVTRRRFHICGPPAMMDATRAMLAELGVPSDQVKTEQFGATKPTVSQPSSPRPAAAPTGPKVSFSRHGKSRKIREGQTVLELSEELGIGIPFSCRIGTCGLCKVKLTSGDVAMSVEDGLDAGDKENGFILACQAIPTRDIVIEA